MPSTYPNDVSVQGAQFVRWVPITMVSATSKTMSAFGSKIDFTVVETEHPKFANVHEETTFISKVLSSGDTLKHPENLNAYLAASGASTTKTDNYDSIKIMIGVGYTDFLSIKSVIKSQAQRVAVCIGYGRPATSSDSADMPAFLYIMGRPVGDIEWDSSQEISTIEITIEGSETLVEGGSTAVSDFNTAMANSGAGVVTLLDGTTAYEISDMLAASGDDAYDDLKGGNIVVIANAE